MNGRFQPGPARRSTPARRLERAIKRRASWLAAALVRPQPVQAAALATLPVHRLLVLRPHNQMGDMVCALPGLHALRQAWPQAHLAFVASPLAEQLLSNHPDIDALIVFRKQDVWRPWRAWRLLRQLRVPRADVAVVMSTVSFSTTSALLAWASGARVRTGVSSLPFGSHLSRAVYHAELPPAPEGVHEVEHGLVPLRGLGIRAPYSTPQLRADPDARARAEAWVAKSAPGDGPIVAAHTGAGKLPNIWPAERFAELLRALQQHYAARIILIEGPNDAAAVAAVADLVPWSLRWRAPLAETLGLCAAARLVVANDTGMAHVAAATGTPTIVLFGPTDAARWRPPGEHVTVVWSPTQSIADLGVDTVLSAASAILERPAPQRHALQRDTGGRD